MGGGSFDCGCVCVAADVICGCTDSAALNYNSSATADDGSCYTLSCGDFSSCGEYCASGASYCTTPDDIDNFCYENNVYNSIYIRAGDFTFISFTIPEIDDNQSFTLWEIMKNSLYETDPDLGDAELLSWTTGTIISGRNYFDSDESIISEAVFNADAAAISEDAGWTGSLTSLNTSGGYKIKTPANFVEGYLRWTLPSD